MDQGRSAGASKARNLIIAVLCVVVAVQFWLLVSRPAPEPAPTPTPPQAEAPVPVPNKVQIIGVFADPERSGGALVTFNTAIGADRQGPVPEGEAPATLAPPVAGSWSWVSPFVLRFSPSAPLPEGGGYALTLDPARLPLDGATLAGETTYTLSAAPFTVDLEEVQQQGFFDGGPRVRLEGTLHFSQNVDPKTLARALTLVDPADGTAHDVPLSLTTTYQSRRLSFRSEPVVKTAAARELKLVLSGELTPAEGPARLGKERTWPIRVVLDTRLGLENLTPVVGEAGEGSISLRFSAPVAAEAAAGFVSVEPKVAYRLRADGQELSLSGAFAPGAGYKLTLAKGLAALDGAILPEGVSRQVVFPDLSPRVGFKDPGMFLTPNGARSLAVSSVNLAEAGLTVDKVYLNNLFFFLQYNSWSMFSDTDYAGELSHMMGDRLLETSLALRHPQNKPVDTALKLGDFFDTASPGLYRVMLTAPGSYEGSQRYVLVTDLGLVAKKGQDEVLVWASRFSDLSAVGGAEVTLVSDQNQVLARGRTDAKGLVRFTNLGPAIAENRPYMILAHKDKETSFLVFDRFATDMAGLDVGGATVSPAGLTAFLWGERDLYRPGETVTGAGLVRAANLSLPRKQPLRLRLTDPRGQEVDTRVTPLDPAGWLTFSYPLPASALTGNYTLELLAGESVVGQYRFQLEEFVPDRIKVGLTPGAPFGLTGRELGLTVTSRYLFGPPAAGLPADLSVTLKPAPVGFPGFEDYVFGDPEGSFQTREVFSGEEKLNEAGEAAFGVALPAGLKPPAGLAAVVSARVSEQGGRGVTAMRTIPVHAYPAYVGLKKLAREDVPLDARVEFTFAVVSPEGAATPGGRLVAELVRDRWQTVLRRTPDGSFRYESVRDAEVVSSQDLPAGQAAGGFGFTPPAFGSYRAVLSDPETGAKSQLSFFVSGAGYSPWAVEHPGRLELKPGKNAYLAGEEAHVQLRAPYPGKALVTLEREGVLETQVVDVPGNTATVSFKLTAGHAPTVYVTALLVRAAGDLEPGTAARAFGAVALPVGQAADRLAVDVTAPEEMRPGTTLTLTATTAPGAKLTLSVVDEGILSLIAQKTPDPFGFFYAKRALGVTTFDIHSLLFPEAKLAGKAQAGGGDELAALRQFLSTEGMRRKKPVAFWSGVLTADAAGKAGFAVELPEFQGAVRVMAVAGEGRSFGADEAVVRVKSPLVLLPTFPRFMALNESLRLPVTLRNDTGAAGEFRITLAAKGAASAATPEASLAVEPGKEATAYLELGAGEAPGVAELVLTAGGNGETSTASADVPVRSPLPYARRIETGRLAGAETSFAPKAEGLIPVTVTRSVRLGALPLIPFAGKLAELLSYPYGCAEQTVSRAFPLLHLADLAKALEPELFAARSAPGMVISALRALSSMQTGRGGFAMWPGGAEDAPWASVYAAHFLVEAGDAGYAVDETMRERALDFVAGLAKIRPGAETDERRTALYALFVLARAGRADLGSMDFVRSSLLASLGDDERALLAAAYVLAGQDGNVGALLGFDPASRPPVRETGGTFDSPLRRLALTALALEQAAPEDPRLPGMIDALSRELSAAPGVSTQEAAFGFLALGRFVAVQTDKGPFAGTLKRGETVLGRFDQEHELVLGEIAGEEPLTVALEEGAPEAVFYAVTTRGAPAVADYKPGAQGLSIRREFLTREGAALDLSKVRQGDLLVARVSVRSAAGPVANVVIQNLLPVGLEVENPRLATTERLPWMGDNLLEAAYQDLRDDRVLFFADLPADKEVAQYTLLRAVTAGSFVLPPVRVEAMYDPALYADGELSRLTVLPRE